MRSGQTCQVGSGRAWLVWVACVPGCVGYGRLRQAIGRVAGCQWAVTPVTRRIATGTNGRFNQRPFPRPLTPLVGSLAAFAGRFTGPSGLGKRSSEPFAAPSAPTTCSTAIRCAGLRQGRGNGRFPPNSSARSYRQTLPGHCPGNVAHGGNGRRSCLAALPSPGCTEMRQTSYRTIEGAAFNQIVSPLSVRQAPTAQPAARRRGGLLDARQRVRVAPLNGKSGAIAGRRAADRLACRSAGCRFAGWRGRFSRAFVRRISQRPR